MSISRQVTSGISMLVSVLLLFIMGCSGGSSTVLQASSSISRITETSYASKSISAANGGTVTHDEFTVNLPANALPGDAQIKVSKVSVSNSKEIPSLVDMTKTYVLSTTSATKDFELNSSANVEFKITPAGFDPSSIRLVLWDGREWQEVPAQYDEARQVVSTTVNVIMPYGTRIYFVNPNEKTKRGKEVITEFLAVKIVGTKSAGAGAKTSAAAIDDRAKRIESANFTVQYTNATDEAAARAVSTYLEDALNRIVGQMSLRRPGKSALMGFDMKKWPIIFTEIGDAYGQADAENFIKIQEGTEPGEGLEHTCNHEFLHLVQWATLKSVGNGQEDGLSWFDETMADGVGYYAVYGLGHIFCAADTDMGYFEERLDGDEYTLGDANDDYEYMHFPFISYILATFGQASFKSFFETFYGYTPGKTQINMTTIDTAAIKGLGKSISGNNGIFWDFYRDYFISGIIFNKDNFLNFDGKNLPDRPSGAPFDITEETREAQGVAIATFPGADYQKDFTMPRLSGQVAILRYAGTSGGPIDLKVSIASSPGQATGRIQLVSFKRSGGILQPAGLPDDVNAGTPWQKDYSGFGTDITDIYVVMANTSSQVDGFKVTVKAAVIPLAVGAGAKR